jgi:hypothetical protein
MMVDDGRWCRVQCRGMVSSCNLPWGDSTMVQLSGTLLGAPRADTKVGCQDIQAVWTSPHAAHLCDTAVYKARTVHLALWVPLSSFESLVRLALAMSLAHWHFHCCQGGVKGRILRDLQAVLNSNASRNMPEHTNKSIEMIVHLTWGEMPGFQEATRCIEIWVGQSKWFIGTDLKELRRKQVKHAQSTHSVTTK